MQLLSSRVVAPDRFKGNGMLNGKRIAVVLPAYNAEKTLEATVRELPDLVDIRILVDDHSSDRTVEIAHQLNLQLFVHDQNYGYGRNQQTCYRESFPGSQAFRIPHRVPRLQRQGTAGSSAARKFR